jgi:hypothetical protein
VPSDPADPAVGVLNIPFGTCAYFRLSSI